MDQYDDSFKLVGGGYDMNNPNDVSLRANLGYTRQYAERIDLAHMTPRGDLCSTGYCLANKVATGGQYLVYQPRSGAFTVNLTGVSGSFNVEWFNPATGAKSSGSAINGGANQSFTPPFSGDAVLYLYPAGTLPPTATPTPTKVPTATPTPLPSSLKCILYRSSEVPKPLPLGKTSITSTLTVPKSYTIADLNATVYMTHAWVGDLSMKLTHKNSGKTVKLLDRPGYPAKTFGCSGDNINATIDDSAGTSSELRCAATLPTIYGSVRPFSRLSAFNGIGSAGKWELTITDADPSVDWGVLQSWRIRVCYAPVATLSAEEGDEAFVPDTPLIPATEPLLETKPGRVNEVVPTLFLPQVVR
ncbi:MAG: proprotein convertase P-domain-containing protein [Anaerolineales bacterium]|nr:proprotein convertase P-domain-containing protein [Anaerolineales bacterium]